MCVKGWKGEGVPKTQRDRKSKGRRWRCRESRIERQREGHCKDSAEEREGSRRREMHSGTHKREKHTNIHAHTHTYTHTHTRSS